MNRYLSSKFYAGKRASLAGSLVGFDKLGNCEGVWKLGGVPQIKPLPIGEAEIQQARNFPRHFEIAADCPVAPEVIDLAAETEVAPPTIAPVTEAYAPVTSAPAEVEVEGKAVVETAPVEAEHPESEPLEKEPLEAEPIEVEPIEVETVDSAPVETETVHSETNGTEDAGVPEVELAPETEEPGAPVEPLIAAPLA